MRADSLLYAHLNPGVVATLVINDPKNAPDQLVGETTTVLRDGTTLLALLGYLCTERHRIPCFLRSAALLRRAARLHPGTRQAAAAVARLAATIAPALPT